MFFFVYVGFLKVVVNVVVICLSSENIFNFENCFYKYVVILVVVILFELIIGLFVVVI